MIDLFLGVVKLTRRFSLIIEQGIKNEAKHVKCILCKQACMNDFVLVLLAWLHKSCIKYRFTKAFKIFRKGGNNK